MKIFLLAAVVLVATLAVLLIPNNAFAWGCGPEPGGFALGVRH